MATTARQSVRSNGSGGTPSRTVAHGSKPVFQDQVLSRIYNHMVAGEQSGSGSVFSASVTDKENGREAAFQHKRCELNVKRMKKGSLLPPKLKQTSRAGVFTEQIRLVEEKHKVDVSIIDDVQEFMRARAKLELDHAKNLQLLSAQFHSKRKWAPFTYAKGHDSILIADLWRSVINLAMEDAKNHAIASERLTFLTGDVFDQHKETKKEVFKTAMAMLENLQDELYVLDASVAETKAKYDAAFKNIEKVKKSKSTKKRTNENELKKLIMTCQYTRQEYLLETAAANQHYLKFRNEQLPQVLDACNDQNIGFCTNYFKAYASLCSSSLTKSVKNMAKVDKLASRMAAPLERRTFLHEVGKAFPGRQLFEIQPHPDDANHLELKCDNSTRHALFQMRELLKHSCDIIDKGLREKEKQMDSLQSLHKNYQEAGAMFDKQQPKLVEEKMEVLSQEIETDALKRSHLLAKITRITEAGVDDMDKFPEQSGLKQEVVTMDLKQAQARETERRTRESTVITGPSLPSTPAAATLEPGKEQIRKRSRGKSAKKEGNKSPGQTPAKLAEPGVPKARKPSPRGIAAPKSKIRDPDDPGPPPTAPPRRSMMFDVGSKPVVPAVKGRGQRKSRLTEVSVSASPRSEEDPYEVPSVLLRRSNSYHGTETETDVPETYDVPETTFQVNYDAPEIDESFPPPPPAPADDDIDLPPPPSWAMDDLTDLPPPDCLSPGSPTFEMMDSFCDLPPPPSTPDAIASGQVTPQKSHRDASAALYEELVESDTPLLYRALYTYEAAQNDDIGIGAGDLLYVLVARDDGWCQGISLDGQVGFFPASYVERETTKQSSIEAPRMLWLYPNDTSFGLSIEGTKPVKVKSVQAGTPADKAGVLKGDIILEINEAPFADKPIETITAALATSFENKNKATKLVVMNVGARRLQKVAGISREGSATSIV